MSYKSICFLRAWGPALWRRLMSLGLHPDPCGHRQTAAFDSRNHCTLVQYGTFLTVKESELPEMAYDCGLNRELFLALAALRDDSDLNQWFIFDNRHCDDVEKPERYWFLCRQESVEDDMWADRAYEDCEKATAREIIDHFSGYDDDPEMPSAI